MVSFDPALSKELDWIRFLSKDMDLTTARLQDETLMALYAHEGNRWLAAASALELGVMTVRDSSITRKVVANLEVQYGGKTSDERIANYIAWLRQRGLYEATPSPRLFELL